jgi:16S rRNA processing protein RimM
VSADQRTSRPQDPQAVWRRLDSADLPADGIEVGRIVDAWGVKGWIKIHPHSSAPEALFSSRRWYLVPGSVGLASAYLLRITEAREHGQAVVALAQDISDRDAALALRGASIVVPRSSFPTPAADEYYWVDLLGLEVRNRQGESLGRVADMLTHTAQSVMVLHRDVDGTRRECLIPFVKAFVDEVDLPGRLIRVDWQLDY